VIAVAGVLVLIFIGVFWIAPIFVARSIGKSKGRTMSWLWGFFLGWIGVLIVAVQGSLRTGPVVVPPITPTSASALSAPTGAAALPAAATAAAPAQASMKTCPRCAEDVQAAAKICRYCGHSFEAEAEALPGS
jgi:uncharacterized protein UPF0547